MISGGNETSKTQSTANTIDAPNSAQHSNRTTGAAIAIAIVIAFIITPLSCMLAWVLGYGPGGTNELLSGYPIRGILKQSAFLFPVHLLAFIVPQRNTTQRIGYAVSAIAVGLMIVTWFFVAAGIASV